MNNAIFGLINCKLIEIYGEGGNIMRFVCEYPWLPLHRVISFCCAIAAAVPIHLHSLRVLLGARFLRRASLIAWWPSLVVLPVPAVLSLVLSVVKLSAMCHGMQSGRMAKLDDNAISLQR
jgi:hypothetical protein